MKSSNTVMQSKKSEKINIIDFSTYEQLQKNEIKSSNCVNMLIRNAKYRKKHKNDENNFDLGAWINNRPRGQKARAHFKKGATLLRQTSSIRKSGKVSENKRKKLTRLKKSIMRYRVLKYQNDISNENDVRTFGTEAQMHANKTKSQAENAAVDIAMAVVEPLIGQMHDINLKDTVYNEHDDDGDDTNETNAPNGVKLAVIAHKLSNLTIHSRRFREYCDNCTTQDLANLARELLGDLNHFQRRAYAKNPVKANAHRRFVIGFREVQNHLNVKNKVKLVLIATDCEKCPEEAGIDDIIESIKSKCKTSEIPYCFPFDRRKLAYALHKKSVVSCVAVLDHDGVREKFTQLLAALTEARQNYLLATQPQN